MADETKETIILDLRVDNEEAVRKILESKAALADLKAQQKELDAAYKAGAITMDEYTAESTRVTEATENATNVLKANTDAVKQNVREDTSKKDSLVALRAELKKATTAFDNLSRSEREGAKGKALLQHIKELTDEVKAAEESTGRFQRNVGNYKSVWGGMEAGLNGAKDAFEGLGMSAGGKAVDGVNKVTKGFKALLANPIGIVITVIVTAFRLLADQLKGNSEAMGSMKKATASLQPVINLFKQAVGMLVGVIAKLIERLAGAVKKVVEFGKKVVDHVPFLKKGVNAVKEYAVSHKAATDATEKSTKATEKNASAVESAAEKKKKAAEAELAEVRKVEDLKIAAMEEGEAKSLALLELQHTREMDAIRKRLATEKDLTEGARAALNEQLVLMEAAYQVERGKVSEKYAADEQKKREAEAAAKLKEQKDADKAAADELKKHWENYVNEVEAGSTEAMQREIEARKAQLDALHQMEGESNEAFRARELAAQKAYNDSVQKLNDAEIAATEAKVESTKAVMSGAQALMEAFGEENRAAAIAAKVLALGQTAIDTGVAISKGIASAMSTPFPANLVAIGTTIGAVMANMATAVSTIKSAKFAEGGFVQGPGTATSDSIPARLSNGESVLTAKATAAHYDTLSRWNVEGGGVAFPNSIGRRAFAQGGIVSAKQTDMSASLINTQQMLESTMSRIKPEVSVREIARVSNRVAVKENISKS